MSSSNLLDENSGAKRITTRNASQCTAYELRQELNRRGAFDFKQNDLVNYRTMLQRLMVELVKDEEIEAAEITQKNALQLETELERSKRIREEKKKEALERSKQRQTDPNYFSKRIEANSVGQSQSKTSVPTEVVSEVDQEETTEPISSNPFETFPSKGRSKIYVK